MSSWAPGAFAAQFPVDVVFLQVDIVQDKRRVIADVFRLARDAEAVEMEAVDLGEFGAGDQRAEREHGEGDRFDEALDLLGQSDTVVSTGEGRAAVDPFDFAAFEQRAQVVGVGAFALEFGTFRQKVDEGTDGGAAEAVADEVDLLDLPFFVQFAPVRDITGIGLAEPLMAVACRMDFAVVDTAALDEGIELTGSVPHTGEHTDGGCVGDVPRVLQGLLGAAVPHSEQRANVVDAVVVAPAEVTVDQHERIVVGLSHDTYLPYITLIYF